MSEVMSFWIRFSGYEAGETKKTPPTDRQPLPAQDGAGKALFALKLPTVAALAAGVFGLGLGECAQKDDAKVMDLNNPKAT